MTFCFIVCKEKPSDKRKIEQNIVLKLSFEFSLQIVEYCELLEEQKKFVIAKQLLKSATAIGANAMEAQHGESKNDFIHKFMVAAKEGEETEYWLLLCQHSKNYPSCEHLLLKVSNLNNLIGKIINTSIKKR